ncbi:MAG: ABC-type transport auxiliary lipoprotein family protein, partial [bacterium]
MPNDPLKGLSSLQAWSLPPSPCRRRTVSAACLLLASAAAGGCAIGPSVRPPPRLHDFGLLPEQPVRATRLRALLAVPDPSAPGWLDTPSMLYRFAYVDGAQPQVYSLSRWAAPPAELIGARLRSRLARIVEPGLASSRDGVAGEYVVRIELEEFSQVFDTPSASRGVLRARATLISGARRATIAQRAFAFDRPGAGAAGPGGGAGRAGPRNRPGVGGLQWG